MAYIRTRIVGIIISSVLIGAGCGSPSAPIVDLNTAINTAATCKAEWTADRKFSDQLANRANVGPIVKATNPVPKDAIAANTTDYRYEGKPVVLISGDKTEVLVDGRLFSDIKRVDLTRLNNVVGAKKIMPIGTLKKPLLPTRSILQLLTQSDLLSAFVHIEAKLCITNEVDTPTKYEATVSTTHTYYTNEEVDIPYSFVFTLNKNDGTMTVE